MTPNRRRMPCKNEANVIQCNEGRFKGVRVVLSFQATVAHRREGTNSILVLFFIVTCMATFPAQEASDSDIGTMRRKIRACLI